MGNDILYNQGPQLDMSRRRHDKTTTRATPLHVFAIFGLTPKHLTLNAYTYSMLA